MTFFVFKKMYSGIAYVSIIVPTPFGNNVAPDLKGVGFQSRKTRFEFCKQKKIVDQPYVYFLLVIKTHCAIAHLRKFCGVFAILEHNGIWR